MKRHRILLTAAMLIMTLLSSVLVADDDNDDKRKRGRFLRRIRQEFSTSKNSNPKKSKKSSDQAKGKSPTLASKPNTASRNKSNSKTPSKTASRSTRKITLGFGMLVETHNESLIVKTLDRRGNAAEAGIKTGDVVTGVGGVKIGSIEEFNQITGILGNGDQLEIQVARKGKPKTMLLQFGDLPEEGEITQPDTNVANGRPQSRGKTITPVVNTRGLRSVMSLPQQQRLQMEQMQREIIRLRQQQKVPSATRGHTILRNPGR